jgi:hypothetical protein
VARATEKQIPFLLRDTIAQLLERILSLPHGIIFSDGVDRAEAGVSHRILLIRFIRVWRMGRDKALTV